MLKEVAASGTYVPAEPALASFRASDTCSTFVRESPVLAIYTDLLFVDNPLVISARLFNVRLFNVRLSWRSIGRHGPIPGKPYLFQNTSNFPVFTTLPLFDFDQQQ